MNQFNNLIDEAYEIAVKFTPREQEHKPTKAEKEEGNYDLGCKLAELRHHCDVDWSGFDNANQKFGQGVDDIIGKMSQTGFKRPTDKTFQRFMKLPEFGSLQDCSDVGFTNVYWLMQEQNEEVCAEIKGQLSQVSEHDTQGRKELRKHFTQIIREVKQAAKPTQYSQEDVDSMVDIIRSEVDIDEQERQRIADAAEMLGRAKGYYDLLGIDSSDYEDEAELRGALKGALRRDERLFHPDRNIDNPEKYREHFERAQLMRSFFNV